MLILILSGIYNFSEMVFIFVQCFMFFLVNTFQLNNFKNNYRLLDVFFGARNYKEIKLILIFEHFNQDLSQYLHKSPSMLDSGLIKVTIAIYIFFFTPSTLVMLGAPHVSIKTIQWSRSSAALAGSVHRLSGSSVILILGLVKR